MLQSLENSLILKDNNRVSRELGLFHCPLKESTKANLLDMTETTLKFPFANPPYFINRYLSATKLPTVTQNRVFYQLHNFLQIVLWALGVYKYADYPPFG